MSYIPAFDCFSGYGRPDFGLVAASGIRAMWHQCGQGNEPGHDDRLFLSNTEAAAANGIAVGAYFFPFPLPEGRYPNGTRILGRSPEEQVERFATLSLFLGSKVGELSPMIDAEWPAPIDWARWGCTAPQISEWLRVFAELVHQQWGRLPLIYTYPDFWRHLISGGADVSWASRYRLWAAAYTHLGPGVPRDTEHPPVLAPWGDNWDVWQYSAQGSSERIPGVSVPVVDRDCIRDEETFRVLRGMPRHDPDAITQPVEVPTVRPPTMQAAGYSNLDYDPDAEVA